MPSPSLPFAAVALSGVGPYGGDLTAPVRMPERRNARFNGGVDVNGAPGLHRFEKATDVVKMGLKNEQPWHRMAAYMLLAGRTNSEIAMAANVHSPEVSTLRAQRWFQDLMATLANEAGADIAGLLSSEAQNSLNMMVDIRDDPNEIGRAHV